MVASGREARYAFAVREMTTTTMSADEIHQLGLRSRADILERYRRHTEEMWKRLATLFTRLPARQPVIAAIEEFREAESPGAQYIDGAPDGSRSGMVRVNTGDATRRLIIDIESTAYHEGVPGHHLQVSIQQQLPELPPARQQANVGAFSEGWGRLVVDTGLHARRWTRERVIAYFHEHSSLDEPTVQNETDRYIAWPAQALSYKIGELTFTRLRERARAELGTAFDLRAFHDEVLGGGALPLDILEAPRRGLDRAPEALSRALTGALPGRGSMGEKPRHDADQRPDPVIAVEGARPRASQVPTNGTACSSSCGPACCHGGWPVGPEAFDSCGSGVEARGSTGYASPERAAHASAQDGPGGRRQLVMPS